MNLKAKSHDPLQFYPIWMNCTILQFKWQETKIKQYQSKLQNAVIIKYAVQPTPFSGHHILPIYHLARNRNLSQHTQREEQVTAHTEEKIALTITQIKVLVPASRSQNKRWWRLSCSSTGNGSCRHSRSWSAHPYRNIIQWTTKLWLHNLLVMEHKLKNQKRKKFTWTRTSDLLRCN